MLESYKPLEQLLEVSCGSLPHQPTSMPAKKTWTRCGLITKRNE